MPVNVPGTAQPKVDAAAIKGPSVPTGDLHLAVNQKHDNYITSYTEISSEAYDVIAKKYGTSYNIVAGTEKLYNSGKFMIMQSAGGGSKGISESEFAKQLEVVAYKYYFKTSQFNKMADKLKAAQIPAAKDVEVPWLDLITSKMVSEEGFDSYDLNMNQLAEGIYQPPLVLLKADSTSTWYRKVAQPIARLLKILPPSYYNEAGKTKPFATTELAVDAFQRATVFFNNAKDDIEQPIKREEILKLIPSEKKKGK